MNRLYSNLSSLNLISINWIKYLLQLASHKWELFSEIFHSIFMSNLVFFGEKKGTFPCNCWKLLHITTACPDHPSDRGSSSWINTNVGQTMFNEVRLNTLKSNYNHSNCQKPYFYFLSFLFDIAWRQQSQLFPCWRQKLREKKIASNINL